MFQKSLFISTWTNVESSISDWHLIQTIYILHAQNIHSSGVCCREKDMVMAHSTIYSSKQIKMIMIHWNWLRKLYFLHKWVSIHAWMSDCLSGFYFALAGQESQTFLGTWFLAHVVDSPAFLLQSAGLITIPLSSHPEFCHELCCRHGTPFVPSSDFENFRFQNYIHRKFL